MQTPLLNRLAPLLIATGIPLAIMSCSSGDDDSGAAGAGGTGTSATGGTGASGGTGGSTGGTGTGGSATGGTGTGGSATGGTGTGGSATGGTGTGGTGTGGTSGGMGGTSAATGGMGGKATAGSGGTGGKGTAGGANGGAASGGAPGGGMGGKSSGGAPAGGANGAGAGGSAGTGGGGTFTLASTDQMDGAKFDGKFTCNGGSLGSGINPELHWSGSPAGAMSFAVTFIDTTIGADDAKGQHYAIYNIPASVMEIAQGALSKTLMGDIATAKQAAPLNNGFLAPCAQSVTNAMDDNYEFTIYALSTATLSGAGTSVASVLQALGVLTGNKLTNPPMLNAAVLGTAVLHGHAGLNGK